jgi:hypothetical protein
MFLNDFLSNEQAESYPNSSLYFTQRGGDFRSPAALHLSHCYTEPKLVLFSGAVSSACGFAQAAMGPAKVSVTAFA